MDLSFELTVGEETKVLSVGVDELVVAGWAGRDAKIVEHHVAELAAIGVPRPSAVPLFYRVGENTLTQRERVQVVGSASSGEVECFIFADRRDLFVSVASDHTDRELEAYGVAQSKQVCPKPVARAAWRYSDVAAHWDDLVMRAWIEEDGERRLYQEGTLAGLLSIADLIEGYTGTKGLLPNGTGMTCGTVGVLGGIRPTPHFEMELFDPHLNRRIGHRYMIDVLPIVA